MPPICPIDVDYPSGLGDELDLAEGGIVEGGAIHPLGGEKRRRCFLAEIEERHQQRRRRGRVKLTLDGRRQLGLVGVTTAIGEANILGASQRPLVHQRPAGDAAAQRGTELVIIVDEQPRELRMRAHASIQLPRGWRNRTGGANAVTGGNAVTRANAVTGASADAPGDRIGPDW